MLVAAPIPNKRFHIKIVFFLPTFLHRAYLYLLPDGVARINIL